MLQVTVAEESTPHVVDKEPGSWPQSRFHP
jgi:hypothetical protein